MFARTSYTLLVVLAALAVFLSIADAVPVAGSKFEKRCASGMDGHFNDGGQPSWNDLCQRLNLRSHLCRWCDALRQSLCPSSLDDETDPDTAGAGHDSDNSDNCESPQEPDFDDLYRGGRAIKSRQLYLIHQEPAMEDTQSFRLIGKSDIEKIPLDNVNGQNIVYWEDIQQVFPGVKYVKNGEVAVTMMRDSHRIR
ncbi:hypothetical protein EDD21DRAFT_449399 [Dissophora ornata]|nr:hypothetical protein EDD21DRAFT_449399 [Dissophora ornata]